MPRIEIRYGGHDYAVTGVSPGELYDRLVYGQSTPFWLTAYDAVGTLRPVQLLIAPGVPIAIVPGDASDAA